MGRTPDKIERQSSHKKIFVAGPYGARKRRRPRLRRFDCLEKDLKTANIRNWKSQAKNKTAWNGILRKAKAHPCCRAIEEGR
ncbi:hypothetical protein TNCV_2794011 [Trichonephila clavipes]|nr:hypothetical protein TNCV_2794011 [Trichonephila clavipes]